MSNATFTLQTLRNRAYDLLQEPFGPREARAMVRIIFEDTMGKSPADIILHSDDPVMPATASRILDIATRAAHGEPLQYILGWGHFHGLKFKVTPDVLIPRPETAQLVDLITDDWSGLSDLDILDCGTGSGCIAIALARALPFVHVDAIDISQRALDVARFNATNLKTAVNFHHGDILTLPADTHRYDIIVSNPPYIAMREKKEMNRNVLDHEPHAALFVPDGDPLIFYRAIASYARQALKQGGALYFEINPLFTTELTVMLAQQGFNDTEIFPDFQGKPRMARCRIAQ